MDWCLLSPFDLSQILPVGGGLLVTHSLPGPPVAQITHPCGCCLVQSGWEVSVSVSLNTPSISENTLRPAFLHILLQMKSPPLGRLKPSFYSCLLLWTNSLSQGSGARMFWGSRTMGCFSLSDTSTLRAEGLVKGGSSPGLLCLPLMMWNPDLISQGKGDQGPGLTSKVSPYPMSGGWADEESPLL